MNNKYTFGDQVRVLTVNEAATIVGIQISGYEGGRGYFYNIDVCNKVIQRIPEESIMERVDSESE